VRSEVDDVGKKDKKKVGKNVEAKCWNIFKNVDQHYDQNVGEFFLRNVGSNIFCLHKC
jgi:hypothetical protein